MLQVKVTTSLILICLVSIGLADSHASCVAPAEQFLRFITRQSAEEVLQNFEQLNIIAAHIFDSKTCPPKKGINEAYCLSVIDSIDYAWRYRIRENTDTPTDFVFFYTATKPSILSFLKGCAVSHRVPIPISPNVTFQDPANNYCDDFMTKHLKTINNQLSQSQPDKARINVTYKFLDDIRGVGLCFRYPRECSTSFAILNEFFHGTQIDGSVPQYKGAVVAYRENFLRYVNLCYDSSNGSKQATTPGSHGPSCKINLEVAKQALLNITHGPRDPPSGTLDQLQTAQKETIAFDKCIHLNQDVGHTKTCYGFNILLLYEIQSAVENYKMISGWDRAFRILKRLEAVEEFCRYKD